MKLLQIVRQRRVNKRMRYAVDHADFLARWDIGIAARYMQMAGVPLHIARRVLLRKSRPPPINAR